MTSDRAPSFITTMVDSSKMVVIPPKFLNFLREDFSNTATIVAPGGDTWTVNAKSSKGEIKLKDGWQKFCKDNSIGPIDVLVFSYEGRMRFRVKIFGPNGMKKMVQVRQPSSPLAEKTTHGASSKRSKEKENAGQGNSSLGKDNVEEDHSTDPKNPYFETEVKKIKGNKLFVPGKLLRKHGVELASKITYSDPAGRMLKGKVGEWGDGRVYVTGWRTFVECNKLEIGDMCIVELVMPLKGAAGNICSHMNVHIKEMSP